MIIMVIMMDDENDGHCVDDDCDVVWCDGYDDANDCDDGCGSDCNDDEDDNDDYDE